MKVPAQELNALRTQLAAAQSEAYRAQVSREAAETQLDLLLQTKTFRYTRRLRRAWAQLRRWRSDTSGMDGRSETAGYSPTVVGDEVEDGERHKPIRVHFPVGHYYSPFPDTNELGTDSTRRRIWPGRPRATPAIDWRDDDQLALCLGVFANQDRLRFASKATADDHEYFTENQQYSALDAWILEGWLRHFRPARLIEVGSGFSSLVAARVNREFLGRSMHFTCIEPYPRAFLVDGVDGISALRVEFVQETPLREFEKLDDGDVLFVDTSHTVKTGGDVPWIFQEILPRLRPGVSVHIHDAFIPGEYPEQWVLDGWGWNEIYLLHAFLAFNSAFRVAFGAQWMLLEHPGEMISAFPGLGSDDHRARSGASLWMRRAP